MKYQCGLCMVSAGCDDYRGGRDEILSHLRDDHNLPEESFETYLYERSGVQTTLTDGGFRQ